MALISRQLLGIARGSVGDLVYKRRRNKSYVSSKPRTYKKTKCPDSIKNRNRFGIMSKFASVINETEYLFPVWKLSKLPGKSSYTRILKYNYTWCRDNFVHDEAEIVPGGKPLKNLDIFIDNDSLEFTFNVTKEIVDTFEPPFVAVAVIYMFQPFKKETPDNREAYLIFQQELRDGEFYLDDINELPMQVDKGTFKILDEYRKAIVFFTIISYENKTESPVFTYSKGHRFKGFEHFDAETLALKDLEPKKPPLSDKPVNIFRKR